MAMAPGYSAMVTCPYNKSHNILRERFQTHLVKCRKQYPNIKLKNCPFNSTHLILEAEFDAHVQSCEDRSSFDLYRFPIAPSTAALNRPPAPEPVFVPLPESEENWDDEHVEAYNPQAYVEQAPVLRQLNVAPRSERRAFREAERLRLNKLRR
ncbi:gametocyte-specific factor 1 homolog [Bradysia coprophila]|uniref:gametocyte-specific factor 1 homolog n=1 Tax=Bradysia coprophila TaxID=38358 RepID=UPI00187DCB52|nr:gametocyte-specific factor 1 homolog [Bradysia coprophila]